MVFKQANLHRGLILVSDLKYYYNNMMGIPVWIYIFIILCYSLATECVNLVRNALRNRMITLGMRYPMISKQ